MLGAPVTWTLTVLYGQEYVRLLLNLRNAGDRGITVSEARDAVCDLINCTPAGSFSLYAMAIPASVYRGWLPLWDMCELMYYRDHISANFPLLLIYHETWQGPLKLRKTSRSPRNLSACCRVRRVCC